MRRGFAPLATAFVVVGAVACAFSGACGFSGEGTGPDDAGPDGSSMTRDSSSSAGSVDSAPPAPTCVPALLELDFGPGMIPYTTPNTGSVAVGAAGTFSIDGAFPIFTTNAPAGPAAPPADRSAIDFGDVTGNTKSRAVDFTSDVAKVTENVGAFTITGWLNLHSTASGQGGNRILNTHKDGQDDKGIDFVQDGTQLRLGVNHYADQDNAPKSNSKLTADPTVPASNWVFFAVVYDQKVPAANDDGTVSYFFGSATALASPDITAKYDKGPVQPPQVSELTIGNLPPQCNARNDQGGGSRIVRGIIDDIRFFDRALTLADIQCHQRK